MRPLAHAFRVAALVVAAGGGIGQPASAAPFCLRSQVISPQCIYYDAQQCQRDAQRQNGECAANPSELRLTQGSGEYCVVTSTQASSCVYADQPSCTVEAVGHKGVCVPASTRPARQPDPFSGVNGQ